MFQIPEYSLQFKSKSHLFSMIVVNIMETDSLAL